ncbi:MAG: pyridoxal phosphate-dependent aminotransferase, partial [Bacteroidetes bacterium]|nr:pyridoxal phosphate-dependent aminotransferase [Bacteroidota bacterium]
MPTLSNKGRKMPPSPIRKLVPYAEKAAAGGTKIYHLNIGQPDVKTPDVAIEAIKNIDLNVIEYSHSAGFESYRKKLVTYYQGHGINIDHSNIIVTTGGSEAVVFGLMSCLDEGDEVIIPEPFYANYNGFAIAAGLEVIPVTSSIDSGFALPSIEDFKKTITDKTKAIIICNPNNPTGYLYSREELIALKQIVLQYDLFLFVDEVYREFCYDGNQHFSVLNLEGLNEHVVVIDSVSKSYSSCGVRIGCIISRNADLMSTVLKFGQARLSPPTLGQIAAEAALATPASYFTEVKQEYVSRRDLIVAALNDMEGVVCPNPGGAFYCFVR